MRGAAASFKKKIFFHSLDTMRLTKSTTDPDGGDFSLMGTAGLSSAAFLFLVHGQ